MSWFDSIPILSQIKSAVQAISGDTEGARQTQEAFLKKTPIVSQITSGVQAITGDTEAAKKTQEAFLHETVYNIPVISQVISAGFAIAGDTAEAKRIQQKFVDDNVRGIQELLSGSWLYQFNKLATSKSLSNRSDWMRAFPGKRLYEMLLPGTHDSTTYRFAEAALVTNWAQTQTFTIYEQLKGGIRYLDIRVSNEKHDDQVYCSHTFFTLPFQDVVNDISRFILENPSEIVVFAVQDDGGEDQLAEAKSAARSALGKFFADSVTGDETLEELVAHGKNVVYVENHKCGLLSIENSWDETRDVNPITSVNKCVAYARDRTRTAKKLVLMALEATEFGGGTPGIIETIIGEISSLGQGLEELAQFSNYATLHTFLNDQKAVAGSNVINIDFAHDEIIGKVISMN
ncbi:MAG TPA: phosphatidylinositol-specific phospholipase C domain-containing protein [Chlorobaculum sp.]|nr:phosphatidylinositol-specific phospholipase C domain-containing protein [Chlorobaculum sp.]